MNHVIPVVGAPTNSSSNRSQEAPSTERRRTVPPPSAGNDNLLRTQTNPHEARRNIRAIQREARVEPERTLAAVTRNLNRAAIGLLE